MLQRIESVEVSPPEMPVYASSIPETTGIEAETFMPTLDAELEELTACLQAGIARKSRRAKRFQKIHLSISTVSIVGTLALAFHVIYALQHGGMGPNELLKIFVGLAVLVLVPWTVLIGYTVRLRKEKDRITEQERSATEKLLQWEDVRAVGPILDTVNLYFGSHRSLFWQAMGHLLPRMTDAEFQQLGAKRHGGLAAWIQYWDHPINGKAYTDAGTPILLELLHRMGNLGHESFRIGQPPVQMNIHLLPTLGKWAKGQGAGKDPEVQIAAIACREAIQQKMALARTGAQLLRASAPTPAEIENLLRPAQGVQQTDPTELLRPDNPEREEKGPSDAP